MTRSSDTGPMEGWTPVVKNSFTAPGGRNTRATCVMAPPTMKPMASVTA